jgi:hypothetical protein
MYFSCRRTFGVAGVALTVAYGAAAGAAAAASEGVVSAVQNAWSNNIPPRLQWNENFGYCGEVSLISAGLYYGQYVSQYDARAIASNGKPQNLSGSQLLLGVNDQTAANAMHLNAVEWDGSEGNTSQDFLAWVKQYVVQGAPVAIGVYTNEYRFYGSTNPRAGDPLYDHIVPVNGISSSHPLSDPAYYANDVIAFSDNGLWAPGGTPSYEFSYSFGSFQKTRTQANAHSGAIYSLAVTGGDYGLAVTGVSDLYHDTLPVRVDTNVNYEKPDIANHSNTRPAPMPLVLTITVSGLQPGVAYKLYRYNDFSKVPDYAFNANAANALQSWNVQISAGSQFVMSEQIESDEIAAFRAVRADAN